jgi:site-specific DNA recombinase
MQKFWAGYIRVSTDMQTERDSLLNQEERIVAYAKAQKKPYQIYSDAGISAKDTDRPAFQQLISDIEANKIDTVVVTKLDRITRSLKDLIQLKELFDDYDVSFVSITQNLDTSNALGKFSFYILGLVAQLEREMTAERVADDMVARAIRGKWNGGVVPDGRTSWRRIYSEWLESEAKKQRERFSD